MHLSMQRSNIHTIKEGAFRALGRLVFLNLANNIEIHSQEAFDGLSSLKQLLIDHNRVEEIQPEIFSQLGFLNLLSLTHNQLTYTPNMAFQGMKNIIHRSLEAIHFRDLRCQSQEAMLKAEFEEQTRGIPTPTPEPTDKVKCPANCACKVETHHSSSENCGHTKVPRSFSPNTRLLDLRGLRFKLLPGLLALHMENNSIAMLEPGILTGAEKLSVLYLTSNTIDGVAAMALDPAPDLDMLHWGGNKLKVAPSDAFAKTGNLGALQLSGNPICWSGLHVFQPLARALKDLYLDGMGLEKMSKDSLVGLGAGLRSLYLERIQL